MADDDRPDARDEQVAGWLAVEPLDDVTRRRLVSTAMRETAAPPSSRPSRAWRWIAAAAAIVVLVVGGLALLTADGGNDEQQASTPARTPEAAAGSAAPKTASAPPQLGDFGNLDNRANLDRLQAASPSTADARSGAFSTDSAAPSAGATSQAAPASSGACADRLPTGAIIAEATGTLGGRSARVVVTQLPDGSRSFDAVLSDPCEVRHLR
jgi:hypothetical protein